MTEISRRGSLKAVGAAFSAAALLEFQPAKKVEAAKPPSHPEWALETGEGLGVYDSGNVTRENSLTPKGINRIASFESGGVPVRTQELTEGSKEIYVIKYEDETGPHFLVQREKEEVKVAPVYGGQITEVLAMDPYQLAVLEKVSPNTVWSADPTEWIFVRRLIRQKPGIWKNITSADGEPFVTSFRTRPDWGNTQQVYLGLENGILTVSHVEQTQSGSHSNYEIFMGPDLKHARSGYNLTERSLTHPIDYNNVLNFDTNAYTGGLNLELINPDKGYFKPVLKWGSIGIEGARPVSARVNVYDKSRQNALAALTYDDHEGKRSYAIFHLNWETPFVTAYNHKITGHALGYLSAGEQITGFKGINFFNDALTEVKIITNKNRTYEDSKILLQP